MNSRLSVGAEKDPNAAEAWFALRVRPRYEKIVAATVHNKGFEEFLPLYQSRRRWSDRLKSLELPLFPGYVLCRLNPLYRLPLLTIPGVQHFVGIGKVPIPIEDSEIASIRVAVRSGLPVDPCPFREIGQRVRIDCGPLAGLQGVLIRTSKRERVVVSVTLLKRSVAVAIEPHWAKSLNANGHEVALQVNPVLVEKSTCA